MNSTSAQVRKGLKNVVSSEHFAYIDIAKGIAILMIVFAHINTEGTGISSIFYRNFYSFDIPLFFVLAGMTFCGPEVTFGQFISKKAKRLLIPYLIYSIITFVWYAMVEISMPEFDLSATQSIGESFIEIFLARGSVNYLQHNPALWFVPCLFLTELLFFFISKCKAWLKTVICILLGIVGYVFTLDFMPQIFRELPFQAEVAFSALPFMLIGNALVKKAGLDGIQKFFIKNKIAAWIGVAVSVVCVICLTNLNALFLPVDAKAHVSMGSNQLGNILIFYVNAVIGSIMILMFSSLLADVMKERTALHKSWLVWLGERSYAIMAIHFPVKRRMVVLVAQAINKWNLADIHGGFTKYTSGNLLASLVAFIFTMFITIIIAIAAESFMRNIQLPVRAKGDRQI